MMAIQLVACLAVLPTSPPAACAMPAVVSASSVAIRVLRAQLEDDARLDAAHHQVAQSPPLGENP